MHMSGADRYAIDKLPQLEKYVDEQVSTSTYSLEANLALLRLYQFQPSAVKNGVVAKVLLKAIMQLPKPDFKVCIHLIPNKLQSEEPVATVVQLAQHLDTTRFSDFWAVSNGCRELLNSVPGFQDAVRSYILHTFGITFYKVPKQVLGAALSLDPSALDSLIASKAKSSGWSTAASPVGELVVLPRNEQNQLVIARSQEPIQFDTVAGVLRSVTVGF